MLLTWSELGFSQPQQHNQSRCGGGSRYSYIAATPVPAATTVCRYCAEVCILQPSTLDTLDGHGHCIMTLHDCMTLASNCMMCAPLVTRVSTSHFHIDCRLCYL